MTAVVIPWSWGPAQLEREPMASLAATICRWHGMPLSDVLGRCRHRPIVRARHALCYHIEQAGYTLVDVGRIMGIDHTTVMHGIAMHQRRIETECFEAGSAG